MEINKSTNCIIKTNPVIHNGENISPEKDAKGEVATMVSGFTCDIQTIKDFAKIVGDIDIDEQLAKIHSEE